MVPIRLKKWYWYSCGKIIDEKNANIYLGVILSHKDTFMFCKLMELQRMYFFYFSTLSSLPSIWLKEFFDNQCQEFIYALIFLSHHDWLNSKHFFIWIYNPVIYIALTKLDCPFAIFKCHAYLSIIILFFNIFLQSIPQVQTQVRRNTTLIYWRLMSFMQNLEYRDYEEN